MTVRVVRGTGTGPTATASYDAALADAGVHDYNLVTVSSVVPADAAIEVAGTAPNLGPAGGALTVVEARETAAAPSRAAAALGWTRTDPDADAPAVDEPGQGLFYEAADAAAADGGRLRSAEDADGDTLVGSVTERVRDGLAAGRDLRGWPPADPAVRTATATAETGYVTAVVLAVYGDADPIL
jgi:arginine decarboxylase